MVALAWFVALIPGCAVQTHVTRPKDGISVDQVLRVAAHGDWLVIRGLHRSDDAVATLTNMPLSHAGLLDLERRQVIEAESVGVHASPLDVFVGKAERLLVVRPIWASEATAHTAIDRARVLIGHNYDYLGLIGLNEPDRYYCTELVLSVYQPAGTRLSNSFPPVVAPGQLYHWGTVLYDSGPVQR
jgi:Permuted papain-like amidase enzyme, YaeF/YiiX, C92 family